MVKFISLNSASTPSKFFARLQLNSAEPIWDGSGQPKEIADALVGAGLLLFSNKLQRWLPVVANLRRRSVISQFTHLASRAARVARALQYNPELDGLITAATEPESPDIDDDIPAFQVFQRPLPQAHNTVCFQVKGCKVPAITIPLRLVRMWFPDLTYPRGLSISVKIDGRRARTAEEVKIYVRLDDRGQGQNIGRWFNLLQYSKSRKPSDALWQYILDQQKITTSEST